MEAPKTQMAKAILIGESAVLALLTITDLKLYCRAIGTRPAWCGLRSNRTGEDQEANSYCHLIFDKGVRCSLEKIVLRNLDSCTSKIDPISWSPMVTLM